MGPPGRAATALPGPGQLLVRLTSLPFSCMLAVSGNWHATHAWIEKRADSVRAACTQCPQLWLCRAECGAAERQRAVSELDESRSHPSGVTTIAFVPNNTLDVLPRADRPPRPRVELRAHSNWALHAVKCVGLIDGPHALVN